MKNTSIYLFKIYWFSWLFGTDGGNAEARDTRCNRASGKQTVELGSMTCSLWNTHRYTRTEAHTHMHACWDIQTCHWTGLLLSWENWYPLISTHTHTHKHTAHHDSSLGRLIRNARESVCMCLCFYMCVWESLMARIRLLTLCVSERRIKQDKNMLTHTDTHIQREALLLRLNLTLQTTCRNDYKFYSNTADTWGEGDNLFL